MASELFTVTILDEQGLLWSAIDIELDMRQAITNALQNFANAWPHDDSVEMELMLMPKAQDVNGPVELRMVFMKYPVWRSVIVYYVEVEVKAFVRCVRATIRRHPEVRYLHGFRFIDDCPPADPISDASLKVQCVATSCCNSLQAWHFSKRSSRRLKNPGLIDR